MNTNSSATTELAVAAHGLVKTFGDLRAVDGIDLEVRRGEVFGVLGPNGAGKTTMLQMLATLLPDGRRQRRDLRRRRQAAPARGAPAGRRHRAVRLGRREPHRPREPLAVRPAARPVDRSRPRSTAEELLGRFGLEDAGGQADLAVLRRHAAPAGPGRQPDLPAAADLPRRADHRPRPAHPRPDVGDHPRAGRPGLHGAADHAVPRRGRPARRPDRGHRPRPQGRRGHARPAQEPRSAPRPCSCGCSTRHRPAQAVDVVRRVVGEEPVLTPEAGGINVAAARRQPRRRRADRPARAGAADHLRDRPEAHPRRGVHGPDRPRRRGRPDPRPEMEPVR